MNYKILPKLVNIIFLFLVIFILPPSKQHNLKKVMSHEYHFYLIQNALSNYAKDSLCHTL